MSVKNIIYYLILHLLTPIFYSALLRLDPGIQLMLDPRQLLRESLWRNVVKFVRDWINSLRNVDLEDEMEQDSSHVG